VNSVQYTIINSIDIDVFWFRRKSFGMNANEAAVRNAYQVAERKDYAAWVNCFTEDGHLPMNQSG